MSNDKQSSSIEFFWNQLPEILPFTVDTETAVKLWGAFEQAKAMHKEEIKDAQIDGSMNSTLVEYRIPHYYNETFGGTEL
jgi:hypothetical protein